MNSVSGIGTVRVFLVDSTSVQHTSDTILNEAIIDYGYMKASPSGLKLAIANYGDNEILVYPFNKSTGAVNTSGLLSINTLTTANYGLEFSPNSNILYYSDIFSGPIYQVDLTSTLTSTPIGTITNNTGALQLGSDNIIYIAKAFQNSLAAILNPNILGVGCNVNNTYVTLLSGSLCQYGLPNLISNFCTDESDCGCTGCNKDAEAQNEELIERAKIKYNTIFSNADCNVPFSEDCEKTVIDNQIDLEPCFYFHWGDGANDQIEEHDTEVFYLTICNSFKDIAYKGLRITKVTLTPNIHPLEKIQIIPDRFISLDCLESCTCQTREFAIINRANDTAGNYTLEVEYCYEEIVIASSGNSRVAKFPVVITED